MRAIPFPRRILAEQLDDSGHPQTVDDHRLISASFNNPGDTKDLDRGLPKGTLVDDRRLAGRVVSYTIRRDGELPGDERVRELAYGWAGALDLVRSLGMGRALACIGLLGMLAVVLAWRHRKLSPAVGGGQPVT
jgi:hypothetical protein